MIIGQLAASTTPVVLQDEVPAADPRLRFASFVLYADDAQVDEEPILAAVLQRLEGAGAEPEVARATTEKMANRAVVGVFHRTFERVPLIVRVGGVRLTITVHCGGAEPGEWRPFADSTLWPEAEAALAQERAHVAIQEMPDGEDEGTDSSDAAFNRALAVTLAADAIAALRPPLAVLWHPARHALPPDEFGRCLGALTRQRSPLRLWLALRREEGPDGTRLRTEGLRPLAGREIEAEPSPFGALATEQMVLSMASYLLDRGGRVSDGTEVEGPRQSRILVEDAFAEDDDEPLWRLRTLPQPPDG